MSRFCFDTDVLSALVRRDPPLALVRRFAATPPEDQATTAITAGEMLFGVAKRGSPELTARVEDLLATAMPVLPFDADAARVYGPVRAALEAGGRRISEPDLRIAAVALSRDLILVTGNVRHFARVPDLVVEDWLG